MSTTSTTAAANSAIITPTTDSFSGENHEPPKEENQEGSISSGATESSQNRKVAELYGRLQRQPRSANKLYHRQEAQGRGPPRTQVPLHHCHVRECPAPEVSAEPLPGHDHHRLAPRGHAIAGSVLRTPGSRQA